MADQIIVTPTNFQNLLTNISNVDFDGTTDEYIQVNRKHNNLELPCNFENFQIESELFVLQSTGPYIIQLYGRGGHHSDKTPCEGCAIKGRFRATSATNVKELYHTAGRGYTDNRVTNARTYPSIIGRWVRLKIRVTNQSERDNSNTNTNVTPVKIEDYVDDVLVGSYIDMGGWATAIPPPPDCPRRQFGISGVRSSDEILNMAGNLVTIRSDGDTIYRFKYLRISEV
jgi:hypothetical protein